MFRQPFYLFIIYLITYSGYSQEKNKKPFDIDVNYFYGTILEHNPDISHLITEHPKGFMISFNQKTFGDREWERLYNCPDYGFSFIHQDMKNTYLGENYSIYGHLNFYFFQRNLQFRVGQGIAITTNPYDRNTNYINNAYGSRLLSSTYLKINYKKNNIIENLGLETGVSIIHYSNASSKAPNNSTNTFTFNLGLNYTFNDNQEIKRYSGKKNIKYTEPISYTFAFRMGVNETDVIGSGQFPFYTLSAYASKRINKKSSLQLGTDVFFAEFLKEYVRYQSIAFPEEGINGDEDWKRVGLIVGHELHIGDLSLLTQLGFYLIYPFEYQGRIYNRIGLQYTVYKDIFVAATVKSHGATAEGVEFGVGIKI